MFNLAEILTLLIGCLLALVFIDGIRRALRTRKSKLKVDLIDLSSEVSLDFEEEWKQGFEENEDLEELSDPIHEEPDPDIQPQPQINLNIIPITAIAVNVNTIFFVENSFLISCNFINFQFVFLLYFPRKYHSANAPDTQTEYRDPRIGCPCERC